MLLLDSIGKKQVPTTIFHIGLKSSFLNAQKPFAYRWNPFDSLIAMLGILVISVLMIISKYKFKYPSKGEEICCTRLQKAISI